MLSKVISKLIDIAMAALLYFGLFVGNEYASNVFWAAFWIFVVMLVLLLAITAIEDTRAKMIETRKPRSKAAYCYSISYDAAFSIALAASGFIFTAVMWFILQGILHLVINSIDNEINEANK